MSDYFSVWENALINKPKLRTYMLSKASIETEDYVMARISQKRRACFASLRMGVYPLKIETDRWRGKPLSERKCDQCDDNVIECEHHFLLKCKRFELQRQSLIDGILVRCPNFNNFEDTEKLCYLLKDILRYQSTLYHVQKLESSASQISKTILVRAISWK